MITVVTDNLDEHTILSLTVSTLPMFNNIQIMNRMYCTKNLKNLLFENIFSHQYCDRHVDHGSTLVDVDRRVDTDRRGST